METKLTKKEKEYIVACFADTVPAVKTWTDISNMPAGMISMFLDNRQIAQQTGEDWPLDKSITEKFLSYHNVSLGIDYKDYFEGPFYEIEKKQKVA